MMKHSFLFAAALVFVLSACGEKARPPAPAQAPVPAAKAPEVRPTPPQSTAVPAAETAPVASPASPAAPKPPAASAAALQGDGVNYILLTKPQPTETGKKIELIEFFWYACPHCNALQPSLLAWLKRKPADVELRRIPAVLDSSWIQLARTYYAIEAMGLVDKLHEEVFAAIHQQRALDPRMLGRDPEPLFAWVASKGVDRKKFMDTYSSFAVSNRTQRAADLSRNYDVPHTPVLVVDGRYLTSPSMKGNASPNGSTDYDKFFGNLDQLIDVARRERAKK